MRLACHHNNSPEGEAPMIRTAAVSIAVFLPADLPKRAAATAAMIY